MPGYIQKFLHKFQHPVPKYPEHAPYQAYVEKYGTRVQYSEGPDTEKPLTPAAINLLQ